jgi:hypothetical protein
MDIEQLREQLITHWNALSNTGTDLLPRPYSGHYVWGSTLSARTTFPWASMVRVAVQFPDSPVWNRKKYGRNAGKIGLVIGACRRVQVPTLWLVLFPDGEICPYLSSSLMTLIQKLPKEAQPVNTATLAPPENPFLKRFGAIKPSFNDVVKAAEDNIPPNSA